MMRPRLRDVARRAGVSAGTVSNVLNRPDAVSPKFRSRVERALTELNYVRDAAAGALRSGISQLVGVAVFDITNPFFMEAASGMDQRLAREGFVMALASTHADAQQEARLLRELEAQHVRGILLTPVASDLAVVREVVTRGTRVVLYDSMTSPRGISSVAVDDVAGAELAVQHLLELGHRRIAFLNGPRSVRQARDRLAGARRAISRVESARADLIVREAQDFTATAGRAGADWLIENVDPLPTAIFCADDLIAIGAMVALRDHQIRVPERVSVIGFDDIPAARSIPLTTVRQPMAELGWLAADLLLSGRVCHEKRVPTLLVRQSTGPAPY
jgi:LacI family transcriptional regulator